MDATLSSVLHGAYIEGTRIAGGAETVSDPKASPGGNMDIRCFDIPYLKPTACMKVNRLRGANACGNE